MTPQQTNTIIQLLKSKGVSFDRGLTDEEVRRVEVVFDLRFPEDLKRLLQTALPVSDGFAHWRYGIGSADGKALLERKLHWPLEGMLFDIQHNAFWHPAWGEKPTAFEAQKAIAVREVAKQPKLVPIYSHRYIASEPLRSGNPVYSVYQTDIIYYGYDLMDYFSHEFKFELPHSFGSIAQPQHIRFWSELVG